MICVCKKWARDTWIQDASPVPSRSGLAPLRAGFTLVELMVAIALSAMLLGALTGVLQGVARQAKIAAKYDEPIWPSRFAEIFRRDLMAAEAIWWEEETVWMRTDSPGLRTIGYRCRQLRDHPSTLERVERGRTHTLALGPTRLVVERLDAAGSPQPLPPAPGPMPLQVRVWIWQDDEQAPFLIRDLVIR